jgi:hypothetical protein
MSTLADNLPIEHCPSCGNSMKVVRIVPRTGGETDVIVFVCLYCSEVETKEKRRTAA